MTLYSGLGRFGVIMWTMVLSIGWVPLLQCQQLNRPPHFVPGSGDMARFSLSENTPVESPVYQLRGKFKEYAKSENQLPSETHSMS